MDITKRQALAQVNPKIVLSIRVGKGMVSKALPILLEDINFTGKMRYAHTHLLEMDGTDNKDQATTHDQLPTRQDC
jgi:hypothetical protein